MASSTSRLSTVLLERGRSYPGTSTQTEYLRHPPLAEVCIPPKGEMKVEACPPQILQTPVTAEALTSLRTLLEQSSHRLDNSNRHYVQKLANAAERAFADCALLLDENSNLFKQNNEKECRKSADQQWWES